MAVVLVQPLRITCSCGVQQYLGLTRPHGRVAFSA